MKKIISVVLATLIVVTGLVACKSEETVESSEVTSDVVTEQTTTETEETSVVQTENDEMGKWIVPESTEITDELKEVFEKALDGFTGVGYTPKLYLGYIVSGGTIHCFLCESLVIVPDAVPYWSLVYVFEDTEGNAAITNVYVPYYSTSGDYVEVQDVQTDFLPGGCSASMDQSVDIETLILEGFPGTDLYNVNQYTPKLLLATQVVAGTNYAILCKTLGESEDLWTIVYIYQDLEGYRSLTNIAVLDIGDIYGPLVWN